MTEGMERLPVRRGGGESGSGREGVEAPDASTQAGERERNPGSTETKREDASFISQRAGPLSFCRMFAQSNKIRGTKQALVPA